MESLYIFFKFSRPYLRRYWFRFVLGIILGFAFGMSNALTVGSVNLILNRLSDPADVQKVTQAGKDARANKAADAKKGQPPQQQTVKLFFKELKQELYVMADPWLPLRNRGLDWRQCIGGFLLFPAIAMLRGALGYGSSYMLAWSGQKITNAVKIDAFKKLSSLSLDYFHNTTSSELLARINGDTSALNSFLKLGLSDMVKEPMTIFSVFLAMLAIDWKLTLISIIFLPLCVIPTQYISKKIKRRGMMDINAGIGQSNVALESFTNNRITKAFGLEEAHTKAFTYAGEKESYLAMKIVQSREMLNPIIETLSMAGVSAVILYVVWSGQGIASFGAFMIALITFLTPFKKLNSIHVYLTQMQIGLDRLKALFDMEPTVKEDPNAKPLTRFQSEIAFKHVSFNYGHEDVIKNISFRLAKGERLGLAGESGSGKSSLLNLLFRFYDPTEGVIEIDGQPLPTLKLSDIRSHMALVSQDILLFNATVAENISYGKIGSSREEIIAAAKRAHAHDFIMNMPKGYDSPLGERGVRLSGGQRQRIAIARAFIRNAPILVLDEATASLDSQAEAEVQKTIDELTENRTVICVAHRLSTLRTMNRIIVMSKGVIVEQGGFEELLQRGGIFASMALRQSIVASATNTVA